MPELLNNTIIERFKNQRVSQYLHRNYRDKDDEEKEVKSIFNLPFRVENCHRLKANNARNVLLKKRPEAVRAHYSGIQTCGSVWACPVCSSIITERRSQDLERDMEIWQEKDPCNTILMVTFTTPHDRSQSLKEVLLIQDKTIRHMKAQEQFTRKLRRPKKYKVYQTIMDELGSVGSVTGRDTTFGQNGWHPHRHEAYFTVKATLEELKQVRLDLSVAFMNSFVKCGGTIKDLGAFFKRAVVIDQVNQKDFHRVSEYITKIDHTHWTVAKEVTKGLSKTAKNGNITPFGMLAAIRSDHEQSGLFRSKFMEFATTMKGKRSIFYSKGLKQFLGTHWLTDEEILQENDSMSDLYAILDNGDFQQIVDQQLLGEVLILTENRSPSEFYEAFKTYLASNQLQINYQEQDRAG